MTPPGVHQPYAESRAVTGPRGEQIIEPGHGGRPYAVRPYDHGDEAAVRAMRLSRRSLYERFFAGTPRMPAFYLATLSRIDHWDREALLAVTPSEVIGVAEYVRDTTARDIADIAVMVADAWQRQGVARTLVTALAGLARGRGVAELRADVLPGNVPARAAVRSGWPRIPGTRSEDGVIVFRLPVPGPEIDPALKTQLPE